MKIESDNEFIYLFFERGDHKNDGEIRKRVISKLKARFSTEEMVYESEPKLWKFNYDQETIDKLKEIVNEETRISNSQVRF